MVAPFGPGAGVAANAFETEDFAHQPGEAGAVVGLAVRDHFLVALDAALGQLPAYLFQIAQAQVVVLVHGVGPLVVGGAGDVAGLLGGCRWQPDPDRRR